MNPLKHFFPGLIFESARDARSKNPSHRALPEGEAGTSVVPRSLTKANFYRVASLTGISIYPGIDWSHVQAFEGACDAGILIFRPLLYWTVVKCGISIPKVQWNRDHSDYTVSASAMPDHCEQHPDSKP